MYHTERCRTLDHQHPHLSGPSPLRLRLSLCCSAPTRSSPTRQPPTNLCLQPPCKPPQRLFPLPLLQSSPSHCSHNKTRHDRQPTSHFPSSWWCRSLRRTPDLQWTPPRPSRLFLQLRHSCRRFDHPP